MKASPAHARQRKDPIPLDPTDGVTSFRVENPNVLRRFLRLCFPSKSALLIALFTCVIVPASLVGMHIHENPKLSPIDEGAHLDYVTRIERLSMPRMGQRLQPSTLRVTVCDGIVLAVKLPPCDARTLTPQEFPGGGYQYEAQQPPTYYAATVPFRLFFFDVLGVSDPDATRLVGILWLVGGLLFLWAAARLLRLAPGVIGAALLLIGAAPVVVYESAIVTNDAASVLAAGMTLFFAALAWRKPGWWTAPTLFVVAAVVTSFKTTDVLPVVAVAVTFAIMAWKDRRPEMAPTQTFGGFMRSWLPTGGALLIGGAASAATWLVVSQKLSLVNLRTFAVFGILRTHPVSVALIAREALTLLAPATGSFDPLRSAPVRAVGQPRDHHRHTADVPAGGRGSGRSVRTASPVVPLAGTYHGAAALRRRSGTRHQHLAHVQHRSGLVGPLRDVPGSIPGSGLVCRLPREVAPAHHLGVRPVELRVEPVLQRWSR